MLLLKILFDKYYKRDIKDFEINVHVLCNQLLAHDQNNYLETNPFDNINY